MGHWENWQVLWNLPCLGHFFICWSYMLFFKANACLSMGIFLLLVIFMRVSGCLKTRRRGSPGKMLFWDVRHKIDVCNPSVFASLFCLYRRFCSWKCFYIPHLNVSKTWRTLNTKGLTQNRHLLCWAEQDRDFLPVEIFFEIAAENCSSQNAFQEECELHDL